MCQLRLQYAYTRRVEGRDEGRDMGEIKGGMEMVKSLYLKGSASLDGRDEQDFVNRSALPLRSAKNPWLSVNKARLFLDNAALFVPIIPILGTIYSHLGNKIFPDRE